MLSNEYLLAKIGADTEENEPSKVFFFLKIGEKFDIERKAMVSKEILVLPFFFCENS